MQELLADLTKRMRMWKTYESERIMVINVDGFTNPFTDEPVTRMALFAVTKGTRFGDPCPVYSLSRPGIVKLECIALADFWVIDLSTGEEITSFNSYSAAVDWMLDTFKRHPPIKHYSMKGVKKHGK